MAKDKSQLTQDPPSEHETASANIPPSVSNDHRGTHAHAHSRSHAAHLEERRSEPRTGPSGIPRQGSYPGVRKQP